MTLGEALIVTLAVFAVGLPTYLLGEWLAARKRR